MRIEFSPPDISEADIQAVVDALRSGWITTGPRTKQFERELAAWCKTPRVVCFSSATAALENALRLLDIGPGDEVITSAYTYTASASVICHVGATPVLVDTASDSYEVDYGQLAQAVNARTKAVIPVDIAGVMCDYDRLYDSLHSRAQLYTPKAHTLQEAFDRVPVLADGAHSFGAVYKGKPSGSVADFTTFSFHAVKNLTTAEGGALTWKPREGLDDEGLYKRCMQLSLHGQDKDALAKSKAGSWEYDIVEPLYKCNMTDITAALGLSQLKRYPELLARRRALLEQYVQGLEHVPVEVFYRGRYEWAPHSRAGVVTSSMAQESSSSPSLNSHLSRDDEAGSEKGTKRESLLLPPSNSSAHLCMVRLRGASEAFRNAFIEGMAKREIVCNVHYKPLPLLTAYKNLGFSIADYPQAFAQYKNEVTLPLHTNLSDSDVAYVIESFEATYEECINAGV